MNKRRIGALSDCPPWMGENSAWCKLVGMETADDKKKKQLLTEMENAEKHFPSIMMSDGSYANFYFFQKVNVIAGEDTQLYNDAYGLGKAIKVVKKGQSFGHAQAYHENGQWIGFERGGGQYYWAFIKPKTISAADMYKKGINNDAQVQAEKEDAKKDLGDKIGDGLSKGLMYGALAFVVVKVVESALKAPVRRAIGTTKNGKKSKK